MQVHVGTVEERIPLTDNRDITSGIQVGGNLKARCVVEIADDLLIGQRRWQHLGGHRVYQRQQRLGLLQVAFDDAKRITALTLGNEIRHHRRFAQQPQ
ncbi:hypothetical protein D3C79_929880 [compost metagenome]